MNLSNNSHPPPPTPQVFHNFIPMSSSLLPDSTQEEAEAARCTNLVQLEKNNVQLYWYKQLLDIHNTPVSRSYHQLPLARVKRIMKSNDVVKMISSEISDLVLESM
ncbi:hypothetical protein ACLB2K_037830 [Fragaria x ananassa]